MKQIPAEKLDSLLQTLAREGPPPTPGGLAAGVWREIRLRRERDEGWISIFARFFERREMAFAALVLSAFIGFGAGRIARDPHAPGQLAREALYFDVFAPEAPGRPAALITYHP